MRSVGVKVKKPSFKLKGLPKPHIPKQGTKKLPSTASILKKYL